MSTPVTRGAAFYGLTVLSIINLLNYLDRYILAGVMNHVQSDFHLNDKEGGLLATTFMVAYLVMSPIGGFLGDRMSRRILIGVAVLIWSVATISSGLATTFAFLIIARIATGIGEAGYGTAAPSFISDLFRADQRSRMLSIFYTAMPLGAAAGFILGGFMSEHYGWHSAFFAGGIPGIVLGILAFFLPDPKRGGMEENAPEKVPFGEGLRALVSNRRFWIVTGGLTLMTFSVGGLSNWMPKFLETERGFSAGAAGLALGATTVLGGFSGTLFGGFFGARLDRIRPGGGVMLSGIGLLIAAPLMILAVVVEAKWALLGSLFLAQFFIFLNNGPLNAAIINVVTPSMRGFAFSISTLMLHLFGDALSPPAIGAISDASSLGRAIELNAVPVLLGGLLLVVGVKAFRAAPVLAQPSP